MNEILTVPAAAHGADDAILPFAVKTLGVRGRVIRLGQAVSGILARHEYPAPVSALLAEAVALAAMLGSTLKFEGRFILQTSSSGPVDLLVADYATPGLVRGYAHFDAAAVGALAARNAATTQALLGSGRLAMTIDPGGRMERYQGIVPLEGVSLSEAADLYFRQSEQLPTRVHLAAGPLIGRGDRGREHWRAGGIMIQHLPEHGPPSPIGFASGDAPAGHIDEPVAEDDRWARGKSLLDTVEAHELLDPLLAPERLLYRLFHEDGVLAYRARPIARHCRCSRERIVEMLSRFSEAERSDMIEDGRIVVTCEFCSARYALAPGEIV